MSLRRTLYRWHWRIRSAGAPVGLLDALDAVERSQSGPRQPIDDLRDAKLRALVAHFHANSPGYRRLMNEHGVSPGDVRGIRDIARLPVMTKDLLRERGEELRAAGFPDGAVEFGITGGTTGNPMKVVRDKAGTVWQRACYWRGLRWGGLDLGDAWVQLFGGPLGLASSRPRERLRNWFAGKTFLPAFELRADNRDRYLDAIRRSGARHLVGYGSSCYVLASHLLATGRPMPLEAVFPTAELMPEAWLETIGRAFGAKVLPYYGCGEVQSLGYTCPDSPDPVYHTCDEHAVLEVEGPGGEASFEGEGAFLVSDLDNRAMPLLRYRNGDAGRLAGPGCACGRSLGRITRLDGRVNDLLLTVEGDPISGAIGAHAFKLLPGVHQFQLVQREPGHVLVRILPRPGYDRAGVEAKLRQVFAMHLGEAARIEIDYPATIAPTAAGKARLVVNEYLEGRRREAPPA